MGAPGSDAEDRSCPSGSCVPLARSLGRQCGVQGALFRTAREYVPVGLRQKRPVFDAPEKRSLDPALAPCQRSGLQKIEALDELHSLSSFLPDERHQSVCLPVLFSGGSKTGRFCASPTWTYSRAVLKTAPEDRHSPSTQATSPIERCKTVHIQKLKRTPAWYVRPKRS